MTDPVPSKDVNGPPFTVDRYGSFAAAVIAHRDWLSIEVERLQHELAASNIRERNLSRAAHEPAPDVLSQIDELLQTMIVSAEVFTDADGAVTGYKIRTGALHKIVGLRTHLFFPQNMKEAERAAQPPSAEYVETGGTYPRYAPK